MRRILVGLEVVSPRCAAGAPPRPRLAVHRPINMERGSEINNVRNSPNGSTFTGVPNTDKGARPPRGDGRATQWGEVFCSAGARQIVLARVSAEFGAVEEGGDGDGVQVGEAV